MTYNINKITKYEDIDDCGDKPLGSTGDYVYAGIYLTGCITGNPRSTKVGQIFIINYKNHLGLHEFPHSQNLHLRPPIFFQ